MELDYNRNDVTSHTSLFLTAVVPRSDRLVH